MAATRVAIIGCGAIAEQHLVVLTKTPGVEVVAVCDVSPITARTTAERYGVAAPYTDAAEMLTRESPDSVHVLTPPQFHYDLSEQALQGGAHVLCEKPITLTAPELERLASLAISQGLLIMENHNYGFNDQVLALDKLVASGRLGTIVDTSVSISVPITTGRFAEAGSPFQHFPAGAIHDFITHLVYLSLRYFPGQEVAHVRGIWRNRSGVEALRYDEMRGQIATTSGFANVSFSAHVQPLACRIALRGTGGSAETDLYQPFLRAEIERPGGKLGPLIDHAVNGAGLIGASARNFRDKLLSKTPYHGMSTMIPAFYDAVAGRGATPVSLADMLRTSHTIDRLVAGANK